MRGRSGSSALGTDVAADGSKAVAAEAAEAAATLLGCEQPFAKERVFGAFSVSPQRLARVAAGGWRGQPASLPSKTTLLRLQRTSERHGVCYSEPVRRETLRELTRRSTKLTAHAVGSFLCLVQRSELLLQSKITRQDAAEEPTPAYATPRDLFLTSARAGERAPSWGGLRAITFCRGSLGGQEGVWEGLEMV